MKVLEIYNKRFSKFLYEVYNKREVIKSIAGINSIFLFIIAPYYLYLLENKAIYSMNVSLKLVSAKRLV